MAKLPFMKFYPADWMKDTRHLSLPAKGAWIDIINLMWMNEHCRGEYTATEAALARAIGASPAELHPVLEELKTVASVTFVNGTVTVMSRRIVKEESDREVDRIRQTRHRSHAPVTLPSRQDHGGDVQMFRRSDVQKESTPIARTPKPVRAPDPFWQHLIDHINLRWSWKKKGAKYLWGGKDFGNLKRALRVYQVSDLMALFDAYITSEDEFAAKNGYSVAEFIRQIPRLVDFTDWKSKSRSYLDKLLPPKAIDPSFDINKLAAQVASQMPQMPGRKA